MHATCSWGWIVSKPKVLTTISADQKFAAPLKGCLPPISRPSSAQLSPKTGQSSILTLVAQSKSCFRMQPRRIQIAAESELWPISELQAPSRPCRTICNVHGSEDSIDQHGQAERLWLFVWKRQARASCAACFVSSLTHNGVEVQDIGEQNLQLPTLMGPIIAIFRVWVVEVAKQRCHHARLLTVNQLLLHPRSKAASVRCTGCDRPSEDGWAPQVQGQGMPGGAQ